MEGAGAGDALGRVVSDRRVDSAGGFEEAGESQIWIRAGCTLFRTILDEEMACMIS